MTTLLGGPELTEEESRIEADNYRRAQEATEIAWIILQGLFDGYCNGEMTFKRLCIDSKFALSVPDIPGFERQKKLGLVVESALNTHNIKRTRGSPRSQTSWLKKMCHDMVETVATRENLPKSRVESRKQNKSTAFKRASEILLGHRIQVTASSVEEMWSRYKTTS